jgi:hypothetical protein
VNVLKGISLRAGIMSVALTLMLVGPTTAARAEDETLPRTWSVKLGAFFSNNGGMKAQASETWWYGGVDYFPNFRFRPLRGDVHIGFDARWRSHSSVDFHVLDLNATIRWPLTNPDSSRLRVYGGFGAGIYFVQTAFLKDLTTVGAKFLLGVDLTDRLFIEANYDWVSGFTDNLGNPLRADGVSLAGGYRF